MKESSWRSWKQTKTKAEKRDEENEIKFYINKNIEKYFQHYEFFINKKINLKHGQAMVNLYDFYVFFYVHVGLIVIIRKYMELIYRTVFEIIWFTDFFGTYFCYVRKEY